MEAPNPQRDMIIQALLGSIGGGLGLNPEALARKKQGDYVAHQKSEARDAGGGMSLGSKVFKSVGGAAMGPLGMALPFMSKNGSTPVDASYSLAGPYGHAGQRGVLEGQALQGQSPSGPLSSLQAATGFLPGYTAFGGAITPQGVSPEGLGVGALTGALMAVGAGLASGAGGYLGGQAGGAIGSRVAPHYSKSPYAGLVGGSIGGGLGGSIGSALTPQITPAGQPLGALGEALQLPSNLIPNMSGDGLGATFVNNLKSNLPNVGTTSRDVLSGLNMKNQMKIQQKLAAARAPVPKQTALFGLPGLPSLGSLI